MLWEENILGTSGFIVLFNHAEQGKKEIGERIFLLKSRGHFLYLFELSETFDSFSLPLLNVFCFNFHDDTLLPSPFLASLSQLSLELFYSGSVDSPNGFLTRFSHSHIFPGHLTYNCDLSWSAYTACAQVHTHTSRCLLDMSSGAQSAFFSLSYYTIS